ncbi:hypothetical protein Scep_010094 [Stephania cephalantha]|uniref:Uncharacterized protein n=1 Tax=Stephania cephalantha TaxID=152367 RepID=A0AAP0JUD4_9MAGN
MLFANHQRDITRYERSRWLRPTDRSIGFPATPNYMFDLDVVQGRRVEHPLTPSYAGADDAEDDDDA